jgi:hypothetical protein
MMVIVSGRIAAIDARQRFGFWHSSRPYLCANCILRFVRERVALIPLGASYKGDIFWASLADFALRMTTIPSEPIPIKHDERLGFAAFGASFFHKNASCRSAHSACV